MSIANTELQKIAVATHNERRENARTKMQRNRSGIQPSAHRKLPEWFKVRINPEHMENLRNLKAKFRNRKLTTVCEEASCPNIYECFGKLKTATFMIMGDICTRRCSFCDVKHGRPNALDPDEPHNLATTIAEMELKFVVITSVDRDDLPDGGSKHFSECIAQIRALNPTTQIEILTPDFRGRMDKALNNLAFNLPDVFNHNLETVADLYPTVRPGADYQWSLDLLAKFKQNHPEIRTKSGIMLGLGETEAQILQTLQDLRHHNVEMLTLGQYLQPTEFHHPIIDYIHPDKFAFYKRYAYNLGFSYVASGPLVRSSYHAEEQAQQHDS